MKKTIILCMMLCVIITGCTQKAQKQPAPSQTPNETAQTGTPSDAPTSSLANAPVPQVASPTPTPIPDERENLSKMYIDILSDNDYFMKAKIKSSDGLADFAVSVNGENVAQETFLNGVMSSTIKKDGINYIVDHSSQMVITSVADVALSASNMAGEPISVKGAVLQTTATGNFDGEVLYYEEYKTEDNKTLRFFFRTNALAGIECSEGNLTTTYFIEEISEGHREVMHSFPEKYQILDMAALGG